MVVIGSPGRQETIEAILVAEGFAPVMLGGPETVAELEQGDLEPLVVLDLEDTSDGLAGAVEPLLGALGDWPLVVACPSVARWEIREVLRAGAAGVVFVDELEASLGPCLRAVAAGQVCVPVGHALALEPSALSAREREVLRLVAMGYMNSQIADRMFLSQSTIKSHLSSAFRKLGVSSRSEAAELILRGDSGLSSLLEGAALAIEPGSQP